MTLVLNLPPAVATKLREHASRQGRPEEEIALDAVEKLLASADGSPKPRRNLMEFRGVGKHNPVGKDPQEYVNDMRDEWDRP